MSADRTPATFAVFDIDGVLADVTHRLHHLRRRPKDWAGFFAAAPADPVLADGVRRARDEARRHAVVYVSGRPDHLRGVTQQWLDDHNLPDGALLLRRRGDRRPARVVKPELLASVARAGRVVLVVDDDAEVCRRLLELGYPVEQATWAPQDESLRAAQEDEGRT